MMSFFVFIFILSVLVLIHEFGHFIVAKKNGITVEEFGWGLPPRIFGKKIGETLYSVNLLPLGGFVKVLGEDSSDKSFANNPKSFISKSPIKRFAVLIAGVTMNLILAIFLYFLFFVLNNNKTLTLPVIFDYKFRYGEVTSINTTIGGFLDESPLKDMDIKSGESVFAIEDVVVSNVTEIRSALKSTLKEEVKVTIRNVSNPNDMTTKDIYVTPIFTKEGDRVLGIYMAPSAYITYSNPVSGSILHIMNMTDYTFSTLKAFVKMSFAEKSLSPVSESVSGPIGIYSVVSAIVQVGGKTAFLALIDLSALLSTSLAIMNLLPIPALDGGRLLFTVFEGISGKKVDPKFEAFSHKIGMILLLGLMVLITLRDFSKFF